ncbi:MAG: RNB domain-containing ribonuclease [Deltaproteobacteria bacterium]|nr:RNB domain-containing ribonuclease [Deltaproteobacteria bacterium]
MRWDTFLGRVAAEGRAESLFDDTSRETSAATGSIVAIDGAGEETVLAAPGTGAASVWALAGRHGLDPRYPKAVLDEVARWEASPGLDDESLSDRRATPFVTIDGASARDLDQAVFVETLEAGWRIHYALADAAFYAPPGSALFTEALRRGASYYLPDRVVPMLPAALSEGLVSLNPEVDRRAVIFELTLGADGTLAETAVVRGLVRSRAKLPFASVQAFYGGAREGTDAAIAASLDALRAVGLARMQLAEERDIVRYRREEVRIGTGDPLGFVTREDLRLDVERYNEQVSLLCNVAGARLMREGAERHGVEPIFRVHPAPGAERVEGFERFLEALVKAHDLDPAVWLWTRERGSLAAFLDELPTEGTEGRIASAVHRQAVMLNVRSTFQQTPDRHHGVGADVYARFTSPMREIVGVHLHHELFELLSGGGEPDPNRREQVVQAANRAKQKQKHVENEANRLVLDQILGEAQRDGTILTGTLMGLARGKAHVRLDDPSIDVKAYLKHQARFGGAVAIEAEGSTLVRGETRIARVGDPIGLRVDAVEGEHWVLELRATP